MSRLSKLVAKPESITIEGEVFEIYPFDLGELDLVAELSNPEKQNKVLKELVMKAIRKSVPDATEDEIKRVSLKWFGEFSKIILKVNGLTPDKKDEE